MAETTPNVANGKDQKGVGQQSIRPVQKRPSPCGPVPSARWKSQDWLNSWGGSACPNMKRLQNHRYMDQNHKKEKGMGKQGGGGPHAASALVKEMHEGGG